MSGEDVYTLFMVAVVLGGSCALWWFLFKWTMMFLVESGLVKSTKFQAKN